MSTKVLFYTPYGSWYLHSLYDITLGHSLKIRDAQVKFIGCDGVFTDCDVHWVNTAPRTSESCKICQQSHVQVYKQLGMPLEWLGAYITEHERKQIDQWVTSLDNLELLDAHYQDQPLGKWVESSVHSHFRMNELDMLDAEIAGAYRSYLLSAGLAWCGFNRVFDEFEPEVLFMLSGRFFSHRVAYEIAKERGVRVYCHERGRIENTLLVLDNHTVSTFPTLTNSWQEWKNEPLNPAMMEQIEKV
ncbi:MAG: hypothetical protein U9Q77_09890, partial [Candidatus Marinimicrobia bacterium]|nr:hypothetical protein [Candidatus Neomarinimicrobiota bacterium]